MNFLTHKNTEPKKNIYNITLGFMKEGLHPDDLCIPCCFKKWNTKEHIGKKAKCEKQMEQEVDMEESIPESESESEEMDSDKEEEARSVFKSNEKYC